MTKQRTRRRLELQRRVSGAEMKHLGNTAETQTGGFSETKHMGRGLQQEIKKEKHQ